jgi:hypothetical protein
MQVFFEAGGIISVDIKIRQLSDHIRELPQNPEVCSNLRSSPISAWRKEIQFVYFKSFH